MSYGTGSAHGRPTDTVRDGSGTLALTLQEAFTVTVRVRANRQVASDAHQFRGRMKSLLRQADLDARAAGYDGDDVKLALYAFIAFLDECVLASSSPSFADWARQPLQEEIFGDSVAGEMFYQHVNDLLRRQDSPGTADVLEVFLLCLRLGFRGRYGGSDESATAAIASSIEEKIRRTRGRQTALTPDWRPPGNETVMRGRDPWLRRLAIAAAVSAGVAVLLFVVFRLLLASGADELEGLAALLVTRGFAA
ncbi:MAG TPA: DotU family type IV/VI secretion system protein [Longimicrobiales bacterium]|nr:DotU family type IV/VI secretion system protein [Longimicrobiales bacterium]